MCAPYIYWPVSPQGLYTNNNLLKHSTQNRALKNQQINNTHNRHKLKKQKQILCKMY